MNDILNEILANAVAQNQQRNVTQPPTLSAVKQAQVAEVSASKIANMGGAVPTAQQMYAPLVGAQSGAGAASADPMETDIRNMGTSDLERKYGYGAAARMIANRATANNSIFADQTQSRDWSQTAADLVSGVGLGAVNSVGGIGALGLGLVSADAGQAAATKLEDFSDFVHGTQSPAVQQRRKVLAATDEMDKRDSDLQYAQDKAAGKGITADLARFGRGFVDGIANAVVDPITLSGGIAEGAGSFLGLAPVSRAANAAKLLKAAAARDAAIVAGKSADEAALIAKGIMAKDGMAIPAAIGAMEAGGAYQGTMTEIGNMTHEQLLAGSSDYAEMIASGVSPAEARTSVANKAGLTAAAITAPFAIAAGSLVKGFEGNPLKMGAGRVAAMNMAKETIEEGSQGITGAIAQNFGIQQFADSNKSLSENVGEQGGRGALYGLGTAGVMAAPTVLSSAAKDATSGALDFVIKRADTYLAKNEADSPASINRAVEKSAAMVETGPALKADVVQALTPAAEDSPEVAAAKATAMADFPGFVDALSIQETELQSPLLQPVANVIAGTKTRPEAITAVLANMKQEKDPRAYFEKAVALQTLIDTALTATDKLGGIDDALLPPDIGKLFQSVASIGDALMQSPEVLDHLAKATQLLQSPAGVKLMNELQQTPESAQVIATVAQTNPDQIVPAVGRTVLKMAQDGKLVLTDAQKTSLQSAVDLMESAQAFDDELKAQGVPKLRDIVTFEIKTEDDPKLDKQGTRSALQHARGIATLAMRGDMKGAKAALESLGNFAQGQSNKVTGINEHYAAGPNAPRVTVQVASFKGGMTDIKTPVGVTPTKEGSINHAKRVTAEARFLANMHNLLNETYNLGVPALPIVELDAALSSGRTADVVAEFINGKRGYPQQQKLTPTPATPVAKAKKERKPKAIKEPKPLKISKAVKASKTAKLQERLTTEKRPAILEQIKAELALREDTPTPETPNVIETPEAIQAKQKQAAQAAATGTPAVIPVEELTATPAEYGEAVRVQESSNEDDLDNASERILRLVQALNDGEKINVPSAREVEEAKKKAEDSDAYKNALPWETNEEYDARMAAVKAGVPLVQIAAVVASIQAPVHDLKAETILLNTLGKMVGVLNVPRVKALTAIKDIGSIRGGIYLGSNSQIGIDDALTGEARLGVLFHEFGHHVVFSKVAKALGLTIAEVQNMSDTALLEAFRNVVPEIAAEYESWLADRKDSQVTDAKGRVRVPLLKSAITRFVYTALTGQDAAITVSPNRVSTFSEWIADNVGKSLESNVRAQTIVQKFFKSIADAFNTLYKALSGDKSLEAFMPAKSVEAWVESMLAGTKKATPVITPTIVPNAPSLMGQAIVAASVVTPPAAPKTVAEAYPTLISNDRGVTSLDKAFNLRKIASRFLGSVSPAALVQSVLTSTEALVDFLGKDTTKRSLTPEIAAYYGERVPAMVEELVKRMNASMNAAIDIVPKSGTSLRMLLDKGEPVHDYLRGKALNIVESDGKGGYVYNQELVEAAVLGSLNWFQNASNAGVIREESDIAALLGISEDDVSPALLAAFNSGDQLTMWDVIPRMAANITEFWGMKANADFSQSATVGIPQAVATEVLTAMIEVGLVEYNKIRPEGATQDLNVFSLDHEQLGTGYEAYPTFLAEMANSEIVEPMYFGDATVPVAKTQMNNADVALTADQKKAIEQEQKTPFYLNQPMLDLYKQLGLDSLLEIFGAGVLNEDDKKLYNKTHLETVEGKNLSIQSAYESLLGRAEEMQNIADASGIALNKVQARFAYGMSRVGRMQMLGKQNPQASKLVREALMPNAATIDLNNAEDYNGYMLAVAQMLGIKVHTKPIEDSVSEALALLNGKLKPAVDLMLKFHETGALDKDATDLLKELMPAAGSTFMGLHAVVDYARTQVDGFDSADFTTNVYVEADGVTNGPVNAMVNLSAGKFTLNWLRNIAKGGLFLTPNQTMNQHRKTDGVDLYMESTTHFANARAALKADLDKDSAGQQMTTLMKLMGTFVKDITVNEQTGEVTLQRGVAKNPLTITIYGSGERGIANKVVGELLDAIYAKMSEAMQKQAAYNADKDSSGAEMTFAQAMFGFNGSANKTADALFSEFRNALAQLSTRIVVYSSKKEKYFNVPHSIDPFDAPVRNMTTPIRVGDPQLFRVGGAQLAALQENMLTLFVKPLRKGIERTVGGEVMQTAKMLQIATQVQSIGLQAAFKKAVAVALKTFQRPDTLFLSKNEQRQIMMELIKQFPTVKTKAQEFLIASTSQSQVKASDFSRALNNGLEMKAAVFAPSDSGVAGSPFLNIGMGDGLMMQNMSLMQDAIQGTLKIFDGVNIPVDKIKEGSLQANTAVAGTWQGNPMRAVANSFKAAITNIQDALETASEDEIKAVERIFVSLELPSLDIKDGLNYILSEVEHMANQVEARHLTMQDVAHSIDQMASAEAPFQNQGQDLSDLPPEAQVLMLNEIYKAKLLEVQARYNANAAVSAELQGRNSEMIPRIMYTFEGMLTEIRKLPADLQETAKQALRSPAMRDYIIVVASAEDINSETGGLLGSSNGVTDVENKRIYIASSNPEVWVHELVHAATFEKVQSVINGTNKDRVTIESVARLQALLEQFKIMSSDQANWTVEQVRAYREAVNSMASASMEYGEAAELNEFMAWATTNQSLIEVGKETKATFRAFEKITRAVVNTIRRIFFGSSPDKLPRDFFNAVRFNTALIATRRQPAPTEEGQNLILRHTNSYGNDARLNQIQSTYLSIMAPLFAGIKNQAKRTNAAIYSTNLTLAVESAFPMNQQEKSTFQTVVTALATEASINPASIAKAQELYNHVTKQLEVEDFMNNPTLQDPVDRFYAQEKYDVIMGKTGLVKDSLDRSSLMPVFLALATTDDGFRSILSKMNMPEVAKNNGTTLDVYLRNYGTETMEALSDKLSGVKSTDSVTQAIDNLQQNIIANNAEKTSVLGMVSNKFGGWVDTTNDYAVDALTSTATAGVKLGDKMKSSKIKAVSHAGSIIKVLSGSLSEKTSAHMAEGLLSAMNSRNGLQPLRDFANDLLGRVASNANIYDMIKQVRSTVASVRQEFRENVPMKLAKTFKTTLSDEVWTELNRAMGKTDMAALDMPFTDIVELVRNKAQTAREIKAREDAIRAEVGTAAPAYLAKSKQLANYMKTGVVGNNLLRNAHAIGFKTQNKVASDALIKNIDELVSLYALRDMEQNERDAFNSLVQDEGLEFTFMYLKQQRVDETAKALQHKGSKLNHYKGYIPSVQSSGMSLIVADDTQDARLKAMSYVRVGDYNGAGAEGTVSKRGYYFNNAPTRGTFNQGIMQNVNITANGVSATHGFTQGLTAGVITDPIYVARLSKRINAGAEQGTNEHLMPIFDELGGVIAYERSIDPVQLERLQKNDKLHQMLGVWRGRQIEEAMAHEINNKLVDNMVEMYDKDKKANRGSEYVNIFDTKDKILVDALKLMPADVRDYMKSLVVDPDVFWVRRDMVFDAFGYRTASVGDAWTGNSRFSDETQKVFRKVAIGVMGNQAFSRLLTAEKFVQGFMADARTTIVVKSVIVPALNLISNLGQLVGRGVPVKDILRKAPAKTAEIESYVKNRIRQVDAEAELRAAKGTNEKLKLEAEIQSLKDAQRRLTIWPLIEAGEFTAISDVGLTHDDIDLSQGRWHQYIEKQVDKLPEAVRNAGRYAYITKDTALFQGLQKAVQYGDFLAKAIMYDDMVLRQKKTPAEAMARITEEFVNYDRLPGRFRGYLEQMGMLWFYNFKLRSSKVAISMMRNNPIHALMANLTPVPDVFGPVGSPLEDNFLAKAVSDTLGYSIGPGMGLHAVAMNPWWQIVN